MADEPGTDGTAYLRRLADGELRWVLEQPDRPPAPPGGRPPLAAGVVAVNRFRAAAGALISAEMADEATAISILSGLVDALTARSKLPPARFRALFMPRSRAPMPRTGVPAGPAHVLPVGRPVPFAVGGSADGLLHLLTLALAPDLAVVTYAGRLPAYGHDPAAGLLPQPLGPCGPSSVTGRRLAITDDRATTYQATFSGGGTTDGTWWSGEINLSRVPPHDARWIDIAPAAPSPATGALRIDLTGRGAGPPAGSAAPAGPAGSHLSAALPAAATPADRLLDSLAQDLLWSMLWTGTGGRVLSQLADMAPALAAVGAAGNRSPALGRLTALAGRLGVPLPAGLPAAPHGARLPHAWDSALADRDRHDGRLGLAPAAAVLPETDGSRFAITGLWSTQHAVILRALASGWHAARPPFPRTAERYSWSARDDTGRWHIARQATSPIGGTGGHGYTDIALVPPLHPAATTLDIILTAPSGQATAAIPLNWQPLR